MAALLEPEVKFWMDKAVQWGQATSSSAQQDASKHFHSLRSFLQQLLHIIQTKSSTTEAMKSLPFVGQLLGRLCWNPYVTADGESRGLLLQCVSCLYSAEPQNAVEHRANEWIRPFSTVHDIKRFKELGGISVREGQERKLKLNTRDLPSLRQNLHSTITDITTWNLLCHLTSEEQNSVGHALVKHIGSKPQQYYSETLKKMVALLTKEVSGAFMPVAPHLERCSCDRIRTVSVACVPLVTCPEAAPLIGALLKRRALCCSHLSEEFIEAVNTAWLSKKLVLDDVAVTSLWCHSLSSLEAAVLSLLESVLSESRTVIHNLEKVVSDSLLPEASALHCHIFLVVNDVFRRALRAMEGNFALRALIQVFTRCFLQAYAAQSPQECLPLRAYFPHAPHNLLTPLLTLSSDVPQQAWLEHVSWIGTLLQKFPLVKNQEQEHVKGVEVDSLRQSRAVFEAWFLLVQCGHWVNIAAELLVSLGSEESERLLFFLTFYHNPTNRGHQSTQPNMVARQAWSDLRNLFLPHAVSNEEPVKDLLSSIHSANLVLHLLLNFAVFSQASTSSVTQVIPKMLIKAELKSKAVWLLHSMQQRLNGDAALTATLRVLENGLNTA